MSKSNDMRQMYKANVKPMQPDCEGYQYAGDSMTPEYLDVTNGEFGNEIAEDRPMHNGSTPGKGSFNFSGGHYDDSPGKGGFGSYGTEVSGSGSSSTVYVDNSRADRGKES